MIKREKSYLMLRLKLSKLRNSFTRFLYQKGDGQIVLSLEKHLKLTSEKGPRALVLCTSPTVQIRNDSHKT